MFIFPPPSCSGAGTRRPCSWKAGARHPIRPQVRRGKWFSFELLVCNADAPAPSPGAQTSPAADGSSSPAASPISPPPASPSSATSSSRRAPSPAKEPLALLETQGRLFTLKRDGKKVVVLGTGHASHQSVREVRQVIQHVRPQAVVVELCPSRVELLLERPSHEAAVDAFVAARTARLGRRALFDVTHADVVACHQIEEERAWLARGISPGDEVRAAAEEAVRCGARLVLGDRPDEITKRRDAAAHAAAETVPTPPPPTPEPEREAEVPRPADLLLRFFVPTARRALTFALLVFLPLLLWRRHWKTALAAGALASASLFVEFVARFHRWMPLHRLLWRAYGRRAPLLLRWLGEDPQEEAVYEDVSEHDAPDARYVDFFVRGQPAAWRQTYLAERDPVLLWSARDSPAVAACSTVVAVVGAAHLRGIRERGADPRPVPVDDFLASRPLPAERGAGHCPPEAAGARAWWQARLDEADGQLRAAEGRIRRRLWRRAAEAACSAEAKAGAAGEPPPPLGTAAERAAALVRWGLLPAGPEAGEALLARPLHGIRNGSESRPMLARFGDGASAELLWNSAEEATKAAEELYGPSGAKVSWCLEPRTVAHLVAAIDGAVERGMDGAPGSSGRPPVCVLPPEPAPAAKKP